jgi:hypothetical protein
MPSSEAAFRRRREQGSETPFLLPEWNLRLQCHWFLLWSKAVASLPEIILYTRDECHLCDVAADVLGQSIPDWSEVNIETDLDLIRKYGVRIPVLFNVETGQELFWPFEAAAVRVWLDSASESEEG